MNEREIRSLIAILEETGIEEIEIRKWWGVHIRVSRRSSAGGTVIQATPSVTAAPAADASAAPAVSSPVPADDEAGQFSESTHYIIHSPIVGTFYRAPAPDAPPYVEVGDTVKAGEVVCIVEAMKLMNEIQAEKGGKIVKILVENAMPVEYNQVMIVLEPEN
ncbi:acetyl-CoA carboxylase biotin carboxyl carrier protein [Candidatus Zixiibacteriota bacterium]